MAPHVVALRITTKLDDKEALLEEGPPTEKTGSSSMDVADILQELELNRGYFPESAVRAALEHKAEITPHLLRILDDTVTNGEAFAQKDGYMAHIYAMYLLAQFRETAAYPLTIRVGRLPETLHHDLVGSLITEDFCRILASVCDGDLAPIQRLIEDPQVGKFVRGAGLRALNVLGRCSRAARDKVVKYYRGLFRGELRREFSPVWTNLVDCSLDLHPGELLDEIRTAYADNLVNSFFVSWEDVEEVASRDKEQVLAKPPHRQVCLIEDIVADMKWWICFRRSQEPQTKGPRGSVKTGGKVSRNASCPCGSGRKYRKCCRRR